MRARPIRVLGYTQYWVDRSVVRIHCTSYSDIYTMTLEVSERFCVEGFFENSGASKKVLSSRILPLIAYSDSLTVSAHLLLKAERGPVQMP